MALTKRYVRADAAGGGDGTTDTNSGANGAFTLAEMITDLNTPNAGFKYLVKSGTYARTTSTVTLTGDGTATSPIIIEGFNTTEGDLYAQGRLSGGALDTTNFPEITFTTGIFDASGSQYLTMRCLKLTSAAANYTLLTTARFNGYRLSLTNTNSSSSSGNCFSSAGGEAELIDSEAVSTAGGGTFAIRATGDCHFDSCRSSCPAGTGLLVRGSSIVTNCTIFDCGTVGITTDNISTLSNFRNNTIVNCGSDGIQIITGTTGFTRIVGNHITGCGGWGVEFNTSTCPKVIFNNRFRDNVNGDINGGGDWEEGTSQANVTSDDTDADDFTDQSTDDYSLKSTAAAYNKGSGYLRNIGANGTPIAAGGGMLVHPGMSGGMRG